MRRLGGAAPCLVMRNLVAERRCRMWMWTVAVSHKIVRQSRRLPVSYKLAPHQACDRTGKPTTGEVGWSCGSCCVTNCQRCLTHPPA